MIILRQKTYSYGREYVTLNKEKGIKPNQNARRWNKENMVKLEKFKRNIANSIVDTVNNPVGAVTDLGKNIVSRPLNTVGKVAVAVPFPASVPAGIGAIKIGNEINKRIKPLGKLSKTIKDKIEGSKGYKKIKGLNLKILKKPYKDQKEK